MNTLRRAGSLRGQRSLRDGYTGFAVDRPLVGAKIYKATNGSSTPKGIYKSRSDRAPGSPASLLAGVTPREVGPAGRPSLLHPQITDWNRSIRLAPAAFHPRPASRRLPPVTGVPAISHMGWTNVAARNPHVAPAVPPIVAATPRPVRMSRRNRGNHLTRRRRRLHARIAIRWGRLGVRRYNREDKRTGCC